jgi:flagellar protein FlgJ
LNVGKNQAVASLAVKPANIDKIIEKTSEPVTAKAITVSNKTSNFKSSKDFIQSLWSNAKHAAKAIGVSPAVLLAQAALETDWGKKIIAHTTGQSSHNLFNIKADTAWRNKTASASTLEQKDGVLVKEVANFKSYDDYHESFMDYVSLIKNNTRYHKAVENAHTPAAYTQALQEAGYATDTNYSNKIMGIMKSPQFKSWLAELK